MQNHLTHIPGLPRSNSVVPGMAHFAGTAPGPFTCRECWFWRNLGKNPGRYSGVRGGMLKPRSCDKYYALMGTQGNAVPHDSAACKYFSPADKIPTAFGK